jgi:surface protein
MSTGFLKIRDKQDFDKNFASNPDPVTQSNFTLADNGITVIYLGNTPGETGYINNNPILYPKLYTAVDNTMLFAMNPATDDYTGIATTLVTSLEELFYNETTFNQDISSWDTSNVTTFRRLFRNATAFNQNLNNWNTASVTDLYETFRDASSFSQTIEDWNVSNVTNMGGLFEGAINFNQPLNNWNVSNVTNMGGLFEGAINFNQPLNNWNVGNVTNMSGMFQGTILFNQDIGNWDVSNVVNMDAMFQQAETFNQDLSEWCVLKIPTKPVDFDTGAIRWVLPQPNWGTCINSLLRNVLLIGSNVLSLNSTNALTLPQNGIVVEPDDNIRFFLDDNGVTIKLKSGYPAGTRGLLEGDSSGTIYTAVDNAMLSAMNPATDDYTVICTTLVTDLNREFFRTSFNQDISSWDVSNVNDMSKMFYEAKAFKNDISIWCVKNIPQKPFYFSFNSTLENYPYNLPSWGVNCQQSSTSFVEIHKIYFGSVSEIPTTSTNILSLANYVKNTENSIILNTGTNNTIFIVAIPTYINDNDFLIAEDEFNKIKLRYVFNSFVDVLFFENSVEYKLFILQIDNPYPENSKHKILL